jgi:hypothetical protein
MFPAITERLCWVAFTPAKAADNAWERPIALAVRAAYRLRLDSTIRKKPAPGSIPGGSQSSEKVMLHQILWPQSIQCEAIALTLILTG